jgi:hypothetical protein
LSRGLLWHADPPLTPDAPAGETNLYVTDLSNPADPSYQVVTNVVPPHNSPYQFNTLRDSPAPTAPSADFGHVVFAQYDNLTPGAPQNTSNVYEWAAGKLNLVNIGPDGQPITAGATPGAGVPYNGTNSSSDQWGAESADGSRVFFSSPSEVQFGDAERQSQIYVRENPTQPQSPLDAQDHCTVSTDACTLKLTASNCTSASNCSTPGSGTGGFWAASSDGSSALFTSPDELTNDANTGSAHQGKDLYEWHDGTLRDLTPDTNSADAIGADVQGVVGESQDFSYIYFVAEGDLAAGATSGQPNLYLYHGGTTTFIATLVPGNSGECSADDSCIWVTSDGTHLAFVSHASLTGYDNTDASTGQPDSEVYLYDAGSGKLSCASCNPTGGRPTGASTLGEPGDQNYRPRNLSDDGTRLVFESRDQLLPAATNGNINVYEWEADGLGSCQSSADAGGCLYLLSPGTGADDARFLDASPTGDNVFIATRNRLLPRQQADLITVYDARVCTTTDPCITPPAPPPSSTCQGDGCRGLLSSAPALPTAASVSFSGPGNANPTTVRTARVKVLTKVVRGSTFFVRVQVPGRGRITISGAGIKTVRRRAARAGTYEIKVTLTAKDKRALKRKGQLKLALRVAYAPSSGRSSSATVTLTVRPAVHHPTRQARLARATSHNTGGAR